MSSIASGTTSTTALVYTADTSGVLQLQTNGTTTAVTIDTSQNVLVGGTTSPGKTGSLVVQTSSGGYWTQSGSNGYFGTIDNYAAIFATNNTERGRFDNSGNFLVGTTSALLTSGGRGNITLNGSTDSLMAFGSGGTAYGYINATTSAFNISAYQSSTPLAFLTNGSERARIDNSGNLIVGGTTSLNSGNAGISVYNSSYPQIVTRNTSASSGNLWNIGQTSGSAFVIDNQSSVGVSLSNGATSWSAFSDVRLKNITGTYSQPLTDIAQIKVIKFTWKSDTKNTAQVGVDASTVQTVVPEAISESQIIENDTTEYLMVRYTELIPLMISSIQELSAQVTTLQSQVAALTPKA